MEETNSYYDTNSELNGQPNNQPNGQPNNQPNNQPNYAPQNTNVDNGGFLWGLLGCCIPLVGLILFLVWKDTKPKTAKAAGIGALISVILIVVFYVLMLVIGVGSAVAGYGY